MKKLNLFFVLILCLSVAGFMLMKDRPAHTPAENNTENQNTVEDTPARATSSESPAVPLSKPDGKPEAKTAEKTEEKIAVLDQIIHSGNDNDPRLDQVFKNLNDGDKRAFEKQYAEHKREELNARGTIVYLLGKNIADLNDLSFLENVTREKPCSTITNCDDAYHSDASDHSGVNDITLAYPQIMALKSLEKFIQSEPNDGDLKQTAYQILADAAKSDHEKVKDFALGILAALQAH